MTYNLLHSTICGNMVQNYMKINNCNLRFLQLNGYNTISILKIMTVDDALCTFSLHIHTLTTLQKNFVNFRRVIKVVEKYGKNQECVHVHLWLPIVTKFIKLNNFFTIFLLNIETMHIFILYKFQPNYT